MPWDVVQEERDELGGVEADLGEDVGESGRSLQEEQWEVRGEHRLGRSVMLLASMLYVGIIRTSGSEGMYQPKKFNNAFLTPASLASAPSLRY